MLSFRAELVELVQRRNEVETRILHVGHAMEAMAMTCKDHRERAAYLDDVHRLTARVGFQSAIRSALALGGSMTPTELKDYIGQPGCMDLSLYSNPLASIHTTLRRMKASSEIEDCQKGGEKAVRLNRRQALAPEVAQRSSQLTKCTTPDKLLAEADSYVRSSSPAEIAPRRQRSRQAEMAQRLRHIKKIKNALLQDAEGGIKP